MTFKGFFLLFVCANGTQIYRHYLMHCAVSTHKKFINVIKKFTIDVMCANGFYSRTSFKYIKLREIFLGDAILFLLDSQLCNIFFAWLITYFYSPCIWVTDSDDSFSLPLPHINTIFSRVMRRKANFKAEVCWKIFLVIFLNAYFLLF